jgi:hypothetical protein
LTSLTFHRESDIYVTGEFLLTDSGTRKPVHFYLRVELERQDPNFFARLRPIPIQPQRRPPYTDGR